MTFNLIKTHPISSFFAGIGFFIFLSFPYIIGPLAIIGYVIYKKVKS